MFACKYNNADIHIFMQIWSTRNMNIVNRILVKLQRLQVTTTQEYLNEIVTTFNLLKFYGSE